MTYMLAGKNQHEDITGNKGLYVSATTICIPTKITELNNRLEPGDVQWMTAGRGIVHSEMPYFDDPDPETAVRAEGEHMISVIRHERSMATSLSKDGRADSGRHAALGGSSGRQKVL